MKGQEQMEYHIILGSLFPPTFIYLAYIQLSRFVGEEIKGVFRFLKDLTIGKA